MNRPSPPRSDVLAVAGDVPREPDAGLEVVRVAPPRRRHRGAREVGVVAVGVEVVPQADVDGDRRRRPEVVLHEERHQVRRDRRLAVALAVDVEVREQPRVVEVDHPALRVEREVPRVLDVLHRAAELQVLRPLAAAHPRVEGVADLEDLARVGLVAREVGANREGVADRERLRERARVVRLVELALAHLHRELVQRCVADRPAVREGEVPVVAVEPHAVRFVRDAAHAEVLLAVALVHELAAEVLRIADPVIDAGVEERLAHRDRDVLRQRGEAALRPEQRDVVFLHLLERPEEVRPVPDDRAADGAAELLARVVVLLLVELALRPQRVVAEEPERRSVQVVRARLGDDRQRAAGRPADLAVEPVGDDAELADRVLAELRAGQAQRLVGEIHAVDEDGRLARVAAGAEDRLVRHEPEPAAFTLDAGRQECELLEVAVGRRQRFDLFGNDVRGRVGPVDVDHRHLGHHVHNLADLGDAERQASAWPSGRRGA